MKVRFLLPFLVLLASCSTEKTQSEGPADQITVSLDTVLVDSGDEFLFLKDNLFMAELSPDKSYLINFNRQDVGAERIDLNNLKLDQIIPLEKDGPNGIPQYVSSFLITPEENIFIWNYRFYKIFDQQGQLVEDLELEKLAPELLESSEIYPSKFFQDPKNPSRLVGLFIKWEENSYFMLDFDLESGEYTEIPIPGLDKTSDYRVDIVYDGNMAGSYGPGVYSLLAGNKILISSNTFNEVQMLEMGADSLSVKSWDTPLLGAKRAYLPPKQADGKTGEIEEVVKKADSDFTYGPFTWDSENNRFYRFSYKSYFEEEKDEYGRYIATRSDVFLSVFDEDLELIAEALIPELTQKPKKHFVKDGKIWIYENMDDELAFVRVEVAF
ncbi:DUF4221 family protein [Algoriphagus hitonicola]|uniref:DUF4221 domain-containing protein n=1 Tax=Algoriphagus hitonicola TaxID=435880 RepID=A0A1I2T5Z5_9BACT|nr:DUF4221 family protein [Algoriphagus hitonicola]SFG57936.1 protein of unknown function [Algoriphagus hitonicola]